MKTLNKLLWVFLTILTISSCRNDNLSPIITFDSAIKGAYVRLLEESPREFDLQATSTTQYEYTVEFVDFEKGALVDQYEIYASYVDKNPDNGDESVGPLHVKSFDPSDFIANERGYLSLSATLSLEELSSKLGVTIVDIQALDLFKIESRITTTDGKTFMASNTSATVNGSSFQGHFKFTLLATCPLQDDWFTGKYTLVHTVHCEWGCPVKDTIVNLKPIADESTLRQFNVRFLEIFGGWDVLLIIDIQCDNVVLLTADTGIGCGDNIMLRPGAPLPIDINDRDAVISFEYIEDTGDCSAGTPLRTVRLTPVD